MRGFVAIPKTLTPTLSRESGRGGNAVSDRVYNALAVHPLLRQRETREGRTCCM
jgi:hypothetical protein